MDQGNVIKLDDPYTNNNICYGHADTSKQLKRLKSSYKIVGTGPL
jgi:hypothetical protein